jgi:hypothetical protein
MARNSNGDDGILPDFIPLIKGGFVIAQSILDVLLKKVEEAEKNHRSDVREETYNSIIDALEEEIDAIKRKKKSAAGKAKIEALEAVISVLLREAGNLDEQKRNRSKRNRKVKVE